MNYLSEKVTRRTLLRRGGAAGLTVAGAATLSSSAQAATAVYKRSTYTPLVGQQFTYGKVGAALRLTNVADVVGAPVGSNDAFALVFSGPSGGLPAQRNVPILSNPVLGKVAMFISATGGAGDAAQFVAVINRLHG